MDFVTFSLIIDDIVFSDGRTAMGCLGGGGPQTAFGMRLWADAVGLVSGVGQDMPAANWAWLRATGIDTAGLRRSTRWPTVRAWQVCEADGQRTQVWRTPGPVVGAQLGRSLAHLPASYRRAKAFHLGVHPEAPDLDFIHALRGLGGLVSIEPFRPPQRPLKEAELRALLSAGQIFSPNREEAVALVGPGRPLDLCQRLAALGAEIVALRLGSHGALIYQAATGDAQPIPAYDASPVVDLTGAGNAFCGGFLAGWVLTEDFGQAGLYGAVAASFLVEQVGLPPVRNDWREAAGRRLARLKKSMASRPQHLE